MNKMAEIIFNNIRYKRWDYVFLSFFLIVSLICLITSSLLPYSIMLSLLLLIGIIYIFYLYPHFLHYILIIALYAPVLPGLNIMYEKIVTYLSGSQYQIFISDLIILLLVIVISIRRGVLLKGVLHKSNLEHLGFLYLLLGFLAIAVGWIKGNSNLFFDFRLHFYFLLTICIPMVIGNIRKLYNLLKFIIIVNGINVFYTFINGYILSGMKFGYLDIDRFMNLFCILVIFSFLYNKNKDLFQKISLYILAPLFMMVLLIDNTRSIYFGLIIGLALILLIKFKQIMKRKYVIGFFSIALICITLLGATNSFGILFKGYNRIMSSFRLRRDKLDPSIHYRLNAYKAGINEFVKDPIFGTGTGKQLKFYIPPGAIDYIGGYQVGTLHNFHLKTLLIGGLIGYLFFIYIIFLLLKRCWHTYRNSNGFLKVLSLGFFSAFLSYIIIITITVFTISHFIRIWFFGGLILSAYHIHNRKSLS